MAERIPPAMRRQLNQMSEGRCEYCLYPEVLAGYPHETDHIVAIQHDGPTSIDNLAFCCMTCNRHKGPNPGSYDKVTGLLTRFFHPRRDNWQDHFVLHMDRIEPLTDIGRVTAQILRFNDPERIAERQIAIKLGLIHIV